MAPKQTSKSQRRVTLNDIAARCGMSIFAVSNALRGGNGQVSEETRQRIITVAHEMGYDPAHNESARRMALQRRGALARNRAVGIAIPGGIGHRAYFGLLLDGLIDVLAGQSYGIHLTPLRQLEDPPPAVCCRGEIDGLISAFTSIWLNPWIEKLRAEPNFDNRPVISLIDPAKNCSSVHADDFQAGYLAVSHLLELGHRHIVHNFRYSETVRWKEAPFEFTPGPDAVYVKRTLGAHQAFRDYGLDPEECSHPFDLPHEDEVVEEQGPPLVQMLRDHPEITAIVAQNDFAAVRIWTVLRKGGFRIPEDISLVSFDDTDPIMSGEAENILTTVRIPLRQIGQEGARLLIRSIQGEVHTTQNVVLPVELIVRKSTAPPAR